MNNIKSILPLDMTGVMFISGYRGKGKTILATQADWPQNIAMFDFEDKGKMYDGQLKFGHYVAISQKTNRPIDKADFIFAQIEALSVNKFTVAIIDNITPLEESLEAVVLRDAKKYATAYTKDIGAIIKDSYGARRGIAYNLINDAIIKPLYAKGIRLVIVTSHVKPRYNTPGKMDIKGKDKWQELSILSLVLVDGDNIPIPSAIVMKEQLSHNELVSDEITDELLQAIIKGETPSHKTIRRLPYRLPTCDWQHIRKYLYNPANLDNPADGEVLNLAEAEVFDNKLSKEQIAIQLLQLQNQAKQDEGKELVNGINETQKLIDRAKELDDNFNSLLDIVAMLKEEYPDNDIKSGQVVQWIKD